MQRKRSVLVRQKRKSKRSNRSRRNKKSIRRRHRLSVRRTRRNFKFGADKVFDEVLSKVLASMFGEDKNSMVNLIVEILKIGELKDINENTWPKIVDKYLVGGYDYSPFYLQIKEFIRRMLKESLPSDTKYTDPKIQALINTTSVPMATLVPMRPAPIPQIRSSLGRALMDPNPPSALTETTPQIRSSLARMLNPSPPSV